MSKHISAPDHESYGAYSLLAILIPLAGFLIGIVFAAKDKKVDRKLGEHLIAVSILAFIVWMIILSQTGVGTYGY